MGGDNCIRRSSGLATLGYSALSIIVCVLWWHKPPDVNSSDTPISQQSGASHAMQVSPFTGLDNGWIFVITGTIFGGVH
ncbi:uncharacterized protein EI90DRAFT_3083024 [Cantharellus anzutake]|uniref:uncharacterized protein n=1 Tax=Cantharellus anzutake TaxID=1750568 RepID=UPI00190609BC|nr:uncharacterized protein EI90DRAFT_3083024 [Cantharellus anzutake]KAF8318586.1 hypothetical protein EI90DRAFT_3083024 [Cantharellus anzutake]